MSKFKFVLPIAAALGVAILLSCSTEAEKAQCIADQGDWDETSKKCVKCPVGTSMSNGQCATAIIELPDGTVVCPSGTKLNAAGTLCVVGVVATDPGAAAGKFYCDYGELDPMVDEISKGTGPRCVEIAYQEECDKDWGKLVKSCNPGDRRTDTLKYCDFGPKQAYGSGGCYLVLNSDMCNLEYGIMAGSCGTHGSYPNGTVCPSGKAEVLNECRKLSDIGDRNGAFCDYGPLSADGKEGGCWLVGNAVDRNNCLKWGKGVNVCPSIGGGTKYCYWNATDCYQIGGPYSNTDTATEQSCEANWGMVVSSCSNVVLEYCDYGEADEWGNGGCWLIRTAKERADCTQYRNPIVNVCPNYTCTDEDGCKLVR